MGQLERIGQILTTLEGLDPTADKSFAATFALFALFMGFSVVALDVCYFVSTGSSFLDLKHGWPKSIAHFVAWPLGSALFAWIGLALKVIQPTILGCVAAALTWTFVIRRTVIGLKEKVDIEDSREDD